MNSAEQHRQRVIVVSPFGQHQVDLPVDVPAAALLPDLLAMAGLHPSQVTAGAEGWRLEDSGGNVVSRGQTLAGHGIRSGDVIQLRGVQHAPARPDGGRARPGGLADIGLGGLGSGAGGSGARGSGVPGSGVPGSGVPGSGVPGFGAEDADTDPGEPGPDDAGPDAETGDLRLRDLGLRDLRLGDPGRTVASEPGTGGGDARSLVSRRVPRTPSPSAPPDDSLTPLERTQAVLPVRVGRVNRVFAAAGAYFQGPDSPLLAGVTPERLQARASAAAQSASELSASGMPAGPAAADPAWPARPRSGPPAGRHRLLPADLTVATAPTRADCARTRWRDLDHLGQLDSRIAEPRLRHCATIAVVSPKGGVGKTTLTALLGTLFSLLRRDPTVAVDTNPDFGSLGRVLTPDQSWYVDDLARLVAAGDELSLTSLDSQLGRAIHGLLVVPAPTDPARMAALDEDAYRRVIHRLKDFFSLILLDCGTGLQDPASAAAIAAADQVVLVTDAQPANASLVAQSAELLQQSGRPITVVVNRMPPKGARLDLDRLSRYLPAARGLVVIPDEVPAASRLAGGGFDWRDAPAAWQLAVRQLAVVLVSDWRRLGLAQ
jgi:MinD-like ATPase involved in chromosome partitioning or flagellar assembly